jgi:hypothetical protein
VAELLGETPEAALPTLKLARDQLNRQAVMPSNCAATNGAATPLRADAHDGDQLDADIRTWLPSA